MKKNTFTYRDSKNVEHVVSFDKGDFDLSQENISLSDTKLKTKPTTFFKDAMKRFYKNKSSVAGGVILGALTTCVIVAKKNGSKIISAAKNIITKV